MSEIVLLLLFVACGDLKATTDSDEVWDLASAAARQIFRAGLVD